MPDLLGLKGDTSDNIPGVPGVGEKTAAKLIQEFGSLEAVLDNIDKIKTKRFQEIIRDHVEIACLSKELALLENDIPIDIDLDRYKLGDWNRPEIENVFVSLEFNTLLSRLFSEERAKSSLKETTLELEAEEIQSLSELNQLVVRLEKVKRFGLEADVEGKYPSDLRLRSLAFTLGRDRELSGACPQRGLRNRTNTYFVSLASKSGKIPKDMVVQVLRPFFEKQDYEATVYDAKAKILSLRSEGLLFKSLSFDCQIAAYLLEPGKKHSVDQLAKEYLHTGVECKDKKKIISQRSYILWQLKEVLEKKLKEDGLWALFEQIEMPLIPVLANMEWVGVGIDTEVLESLDCEIDGTLRILETEIYDLAGDEFNINSPRQLGQILFKRLGLEAEKKIKTGYSTDSSVLHKLIDCHPIVEKILRYRELAKLKSTYVDVLPKLVDRKTGRLHTTFSQVATATGRLSSSNPNLQNIPVRTDLGRRVREAFLPARRTDEFLVADYSQIELRILAHLSESRRLLKAFRENRDIHRATASEVFSVDPEAVNEEMRRRAKAVNFGIIYGISPFGLSDQLGISKEESKTYIDKYFEEYPEVRKFIDQTIADAYAKGFAQTIMGRRRYIPELKSGNYKIRSLGERLAINTCIQGSAADIIKMAMIELDKEFGAQGLQAKMILQVHDELVFEVPPLEREIVFSLVKEKMENAYPLRTRLKIDIAFGSNWREAK